VSVPAFVGVVTNNGNTCLALIYPIKNQVAAPNKSSWIPKSMFTPHVSKKASAKSGENNNGPVRLQGIAIFAEARPIASEAGQKVAAPVFPACALYPP